MSQNSFVVAMIATCEREQRCSEEGSYLCLAEWNDQDALGLSKSSGEDGSVYWSIAFVFVALLLCAFCYRRRQMQKRNDWLRDAPPKVYKDNTDTGLELVEMGRGRHNKLTSPPPRPPRTGTGTGSYSNSKSKSPRPSRKPDGSSFCSRSPPRKPPRPLSVSSTSTSTTSRSGRNKRNPECTGNEEVEEGEEKGEGEEKDKGEGESEGEDEDELRLDVDIETGVAGAGTEDDFRILRRQLKLLKPLKSVAPHKPTKHAPLKKYQNPQNPLKPPKCDSALFSANNNSENLESEIEITSSIIFHEEGEEDIDIDYELDDDDNFSESENNDYDDDDGGGYDDGNGDLTYLTEHSQSPSPSLSRLSELAQRYLQNTSMSGMSSASGYDLPSASGGKGDNLSSSSVDEDEDIELELEEEEEPFSTRSRGDEIDEEKYLQVQLEEL